MANVNDNANIVNDLLSVMDAVASSDAVVTQMIAEFEFTGLNVLTIYTTLLSYAKNDKKELNHDVIILLTLVALRGTRVDRKRVLSTMSEAGAKTIDELITKYHIILDKIPQKPTDISLSRIAATFPHVLAALFYKFEKSGKIRVPGGAEGLSLPFPLMFPSAPALIPKIAEWNWLFNDWVAFSKRFAKTVNKLTSRDTVNDNKSVGADPAVQAAYGVIARDNSPFTTDQRVQILKTLGITMKNTRKAEALTTEIGQTEPEKKNVILDKTASTVAATTVVAPVVNPANP